MRACEISNAKMIKRNGDNVFAIASNNHGQCQSGSGRSGVAVSCAGPGATRIPRAAPPAARMLPDAQPHTKETSIALSTYVEKWKNRYEEAERKHKTYLLKSEKAKREHDELQRRYNILLEERRHVEAELAERERELAKLRSVSEKLFQEYQQLKHQQEIDAGVMQKVMQQAGEWYKQNKQLKRRSAALIHALPTPVDIDLTDTTDAASDSSSNEEVEFLKRTVSELSAQVGALQADLSAARLHEFEAHEHNVALGQELETEKERSSVQEKELQELRGQLERHNRVSKLLMEEVTALKDNADKDRQMAETYKSEARDAKKRVKVLTHQSTLLLGELEMDERLGRLLAEVDSLRDALDLQAARHRDQLQDLQLKLAEKHEETDILLWEEKIRLAEEDAQKAVERAERAEKKLAEVEKKQPPKKSALMSRISYFESGGNEKAKIEKVEQKEEIKEIKEEVNEVIVSETPPEPAESTSSRETSPEVTTAPPPPPPCLPPPPPPQPPPPPPAFFPPEQSEDMATLLNCKQGTLKKTKQNGGGAIDAIVDQIKCGKFQLKSTDQNFLEKKPKDDQPEAVKEMLAILGTLRKRRGGNRPNFVPNEQEP